jgi:hypothetical protein
MKPAERIAARVAKCGAYAFLDHYHILPGDRFLVTIGNELRRANELWVLFTPTLIPTIGGTQIGPPKAGAADRPFVWLEIGGAWVRKLKIVPILLNVTPTDLKNDPDIPDVITELQAVMYDTPGYENLLRGLRSSINAKRALPAKPRRNHTGRNSRP